MKKALSLLVLSCGLLVLGCQKESILEERKSQIDVSTEEMPGTKYVNNPESYLEGEPKISEVQQAAIKWAELEPERIAKWRKQAANKALLPRLSIGIDRNTTDLWHWETGSTTKCEDDILRKGDSSIEWGVSFSWELGDLIWNETQTSIDVRSNLAVQMRRSILDEVTKLYFERLRIKIELNDLSIEESKKRLEKELKIKEITASIDALTGGFFSSQIHGS
jgi:hypothetical protein